MVWFRVVYLDIYISMLTDLLMCIVVRILVFHYYLD